MIYINFTDKLGNNVIDSFERNFLVKSNLSKVKNMNDVGKLLNQNSLSYSFYFYHLFEDETIRQDLSRYVLEEGSYTISNNNGTRRKLSISLYDDNLFNINPVNGMFWKGSKFKLEIGVKTPSVEFIYPAGVFILSDFEHSHQYKKNILKLNLVDKFGGLDGTVGGKIVDAIYIPRGSNIAKMIKKLLSTEKIDGVPYDEKHPNIPYVCNKKTVPYSITKTADSNTSIGELIKELAGIVNLEVFYDEYGRMCFEEMQENILIDSKPSLYTFVDNNSYYVAPNLKLDLQNVENVIIVQGANINGNIIDVRVENNNPKSPTNVSLFEPTICRITEENLSDIGSATIRANYELAKRSLMAISIGFNTATIPIFNVNDIISITDSHCNFTNTRFRINDINIPIKSTSQMSLTISNLEEVAFSG